jgi:hypothetical protein
MRATRIIGMFILAYSAPSAPGWAAPAAVPNIQVSHDGYAAHAEPAIAVNPRNPDNLLGATMFLGPRTTLPGTFASFDGGKTWHDNGPLPLPPHATYGDDVTVAFDAQGKGFVSAMATNGQVRQDRGVYIWRTDDGGRTFRAPVAAMIHQFADHPGIAAVTTAGVGGANVYASWVAQDHASVGFSRSTDGGRTFSAPRNISTPPGGVSVTATAAGPAGAVYSVFEGARLGFNPPADSDFLLPGNGGDWVSTSHTIGAADALRSGNAVQLTDDAQVEVVCSGDFGRTFGQPVVLGSAPSMIAVSPQQDLSTGPEITTDPRDGTVYGAYATYRRGSAHTDVVVAHSRDGGHTWSKPIRASAPAHTGDAIYFQPQVTVDDTGTVDVTYFALSHDRVSVVLARSTTEGASFGAYQTVSSRPFDPNLGMRGGGTGGKDSLWWIGDYQGLAAGGDLIHSFWNDTRTGRLQIFTAAVPAQ